MKEKYKKFGGWLQFFYYLCLLNMVSSITMVFILGSELFQSDGRPMLEILLEAAEVGVMIYLLYLIFRVIQEREPLVPEYIKDKLYSMFMVAIVYFVVHTLFTIPGAGWQEKNTIALAGSIQSMLWAAIWRTYFEKSQRVKVYYKLEEEQEDEEDDNENDMTKYA